MRAFETKNEDKEHHFDYCFEFDTNAKSRFVRLSTFKRLPVVYITKFQKGNDEKVCFGNKFFFWLETEKKIDQKFKI